MGRFWECLVIISPIQGYFHIAWDHYGVLGNVLRWNAWDGVTGAAEYPQGVRGALRLGVICTLDGDLGDAEYPRGVFGTPRFGGICPADGVLSLGVAHNGILFKSQFDILDAERRGRHQDVFGQISDVFGRISDVFGRFRTDFKCFRTDFGRSRTDYLREFL